MTLGEYQSSGGGEDISRAGWFPFCPEYKSGNHNLPETINSHCFNN